MRAKQAIRQPKARYLFPCWERFIPTVGTFHSQRGNNCCP